MGQQQGVFVRRATGLVREMGVASGWAYNIVTVGILIPFTYLTAIYAFPNGDIAIGLFIAMIFTTFSMVTYSMLSSAMPRSGGEYMFQSRIISPVVAFPMVFSAFALWQIYMLATFVWIAAVTGLQPMLTILGAVWNAPGLIDAGSFIGSTTGMMILGVIMLTVVFLVLIRGMKWFVRLVWVCWAGIIASCVLMIVLFAANSNSTFINSFNSLMMYFNPDTPDYYHYVINSVAQQGVDVTYHFDWFDTIGIGSYGAIVSLHWAMITSGNLGEIKSAQATKNQIVMVVGGMLTAAAIMILIGGFLQRTAGFEFMKAASWASSTYSINFLVPPFPELLASALTNNALIVALVALGGFWTGLIIMAQITVYGTRVIIAQAFDRLLPSLLADVNRKTHTPIKAHLIFYIGGIIGLVIYLYVPEAFLYPLILWFPLMISIATTQLSGVLFPFLKKDIYNASPIAQYKVGNVPVISITGTVAFCYLLVLLYTAASVPKLGIIDLDLFGYGPVYAVILILAGLLAWYFGFKSYQKRKGIDVGVAFREIPPE